MSDDAERKAAEMWLATEFAAMRREMEGLPDARWDEQVRARSMSLTIRAATVMDRHSEYVQQGMADLEAFLDLKATLGGDDL